MAGLTPYLHFPGTAREALTFYGDVFGCAVEFHTFAEFNRTDGPADAIAHGYLTEGPVSLYGSDVSGDERPFRAEGMMLSLLGTAAPSTLRTWFSRVACQAHAHRASTLVGQDENLPRSGPRPACARTSQAEQRRGEVRRDHHRRVEGSAVHGRR
jgi:PhnB protein